MTRMMISIACAGLLVACSSTVPNRNQLISAPDRPEWIDRPKEKDSHTHKAFVGFSNRYSSEVQAREDAKLNAWTSVVEQIGLSVEQSILQAVSQTGSTSDVLSPVVVRDASTKVVGEGLVVGEPAEFYTEHWRSPGGVAAEEWYKSYVLYLVERDFLIRAQMGAVDELKKGREDHTRESLNRAKRVLEDMR